MCRDVTFLNWIMINTIQKYVSVNYHGDTRVIVMQLYSKSCEQWSYTRTKYSDLCLQMSVIQRSISI